MWSWMEQYIFIHSWVQHCTPAVCQFLSFCVTETELKSPQTTEILCCHLPIWKGGDKPLTQLKVHVRHLG